MPFSHKFGRATRCLIVAYAAFAIPFATAAQAGPTSLEDKFQEIFVTAGYSTAMGAALGAALLSFQDNPSAHLRYVAVGASVGFIGGTALGTFFAVSPSVRFSDNEQPQPIVASPTHKERQLIVSPVIDGKSFQVTSIQTGMILGRF